MGAYSEISAICVFNAQTIPAGGYITSDVIDLGLAQNGYFAIEPTISSVGGCAVTLTYLVSISGVTFLTPTSASNIITGMSETSGPSSNGVDVYTFTPELGKQMKIRATDVSGATASVIVGWLAVS